MKISELIAAVGKHRMSFQNLDVCALSFDPGSSKSTATIRFETSEGFTNDHTTRLGLIVWLDRDAVRSILQTPADTLVA
jgi:hypothetical protein